MLNSRIKNKIYAFLSFLTIVLAIGSFAVMVNFLLRTNKYIFSVNEKVIKEKTTVIDKAGFEIVKEKLYLKEGKSAVAPQKENIEVAGEAIITEILPSPSPEFLPNPTLEAQESVEIPVTGSEE